MTKAKTTGCCLIAAAPPGNAEQMRLVRNACRLFMTMDQHEIDADGQQYWFSRLDRQRVRPWLYMIPGDGDDPWRMARYPGYGLCRQLEASDLGRKTPAGLTWWISGGLLPEFRGQGHGRRLFGLLADDINKMGEICYLEVLADNAPAIATYRSIGFEDISGPTDLVRKVMRRLPPPPASR